MGFAHHVGSCETQDKLQRVEDANMWKGYLFEHPCLLRNINTVVAKPPELGEKLQLQHSRLSKRICSAAIWLLLVDT